MSKTVFLHRLIVDGEEWEILRDDAGQFHFRWLTGFVGGSGFTARLNVPATDMPRAFFEDSIRDYMSNVNPETGYLD
jgi:hypothetical protein